MQTHEGKVKKQLLILITFFTTYSYSRDIDLSKLNIDSMIGLESFYHSHGSMNLTEISLSEKTWLMLTNSLSTYSEETQLQKAATTFYVSRAIIIPINFWTEYTLQLRKVLSPNNGSLSDYLKIMTKRENKRKDIPNFVWDELNELLKNNSISMDTKFNILYVIIKESNFLQARFELIAIDLIYSLSKNEINKLGSSLISNFLTKNLHQTTYNEIDRRLQEMKNHPLSQFIINAGGFKFHPNKSCLNYLD
jgi:hypothetical protein